MRKVPYNFEAWQRTKAGDPIFTCSEDAIFYAHLIFDSLTQRLQIAKLRGKVLSDLARMRAKNSPNMQRMFDLSVEGQLYRECLEELERIEKEGS